MISVYKKKASNNLTLRDYEALKKYIQLIQWGRKNPVQFIELVFQITLMDYQKWLIAESWTKEYVVWACSRNSGKSFLVGCFLMARDLLFPKLQTQIISENWTTANDTFKKMEDIAIGNIKTIVANNTVFVDELKRTKSDSEGFVHDFKAGNRCELENGSKINAIAGSSRSARGRRSNVNVYDEAGFISGDTFDLTEPYMSQTSEFMLGGAFDAEVYPLDIPNIRLYIGSASDTGSYFYQKYKDGTKQMLAGDSRYFVADISCEIPKAPTVNGHPVTPLLSQAEIDRKMRENEIAARREYYNIFDNFNVEDCVVSRSDIFANTEVFVPSTSWGGRKHKYIIAYDPASKVDNAPVLVMDVFRNEEEQICGRCIHMENLVVTYGDGSKRPMRVEEQVDRIREMLWEYNGRENIIPYENVTVLLDGGSGGQASAIAQELAKDWTDKQGKTHPGIYDENNDYSTRWAEPYQRCVAGTLKIVEPRKYRNALFEAAKLLTPQGGIKFAPPCPRHDILVLEDGTERKLSKAEQASLIQMDLMREEITAIIRMKSPTSGNITYQLPPEKRNIMHDDRAYVFVLACWEIRNLREQDEFGDGVELNYGDFFSQSRDTHNGADTPWFDNIRRAEGGCHRQTSPFSGSSPFINKGQKANFKIQ